MKTINIKLIELCNEIDSYKEMAEYYKNKYEEYKKKYNDLLSEFIHHSNAMMNNVLDLMLNKEKRNEKES